MVEALFSVRFVRNKTKIYPAPRRGAEQKHNNQTCYISGPRVSGDGGRKRDKNKFMKLQKLDYLNYLIILLTIGFSIYFYPLLPERVVTHWNFTGQADGWSGKGFQTLFLPILMIAMYALFQFLPKLDPKRLNYADFVPAYKVFQFIFLLFFFALFLVTSWSNLGVSIPIAQVVSSLIGLMFIIFGILMPKLKSNWFIGIRTPWTLSSDVVWTKTHNFAKYIFVLAGVIFCLASYLTEALFLPLFIVFIILMLTPIIYSYIVFRKLPK